MVEALVILHPALAPRSRREVARVAPPTQAISDRVFLTTLDETMIESLRSIAGVAHVLTSAAPAASLPDLRRGGVVVRQRVAITRESQGATRRRARLGHAADGPARRR